MALAASAFGARLVHVSAIGADENATSVLRPLQGHRREARAGGDAVGDGAAAVGGVRAGGRFLQPLRIAGAFPPALPLVGGGHTKFQPVYVGDVAEAVVAAVEGRAKAGTIYELGGPEVKTFKEMLEYVLTVTGAAAPAGAAAVRGRAAAGLVPAVPAEAAADARPGRAAQADNVVSDAAKREGRTLQALGIAPTAIEAIAPTYLWRFRKTGQFKVKNGVT